MNKLDTPAPANTNLPVEKQGVNRLKIETHNTKIEMKHIRNIFAVVTLLITASLAFAQANNPAWGHVKGDTIYAGTDLHANDSLLSQDKRYLAIFQQDGNFVVYRTSDMHGLWASNTENRGGNLCSLQGDGNLAIYRTWEAQNGYWDYQWDGEGNLTQVWIEEEGTHTEYYCLWHAGTNGYTGNRLVMQNDSNLCVYTQDGRCLWHIGIRDTQPPVQSSTVSYRIDSQNITNGKAVQMWVFALVGGSSLKVEDFYNVAPVYEVRDIENVGASGNTVTWILNLKRYGSNSQLVSWIRNNKTTTYNPATGSWSNPIVTSMVIVY